LFDKEIFKKEMRVMEAIARLREMKYKSYVCDEFKKNGINTPKDHLFEDRNYRDTLYASDLIKSIEKKGPDITVFTWDHKIKQFEKQVL